MSTSQQDRDMTPEEKFRILFDRVAKLNDRTSALIAPEWGAEVGILPEGHPLHPSHRSSIPNWLVQGTRDLSIPEQAPVAAEEQTLRWTRRESLLVLLTRLQRGRALTEEEAGTLRHHVETEIREADTAREVARGNLRHVKTLVPELEQAQAAIERVRGYLEARLEQVAVDPADVLNILTGATEPPLSPYYSHEDCGFHWHGSDGMDIPMRDGQPVCPRCELRKVERRLKISERRRDELREESLRRGKNVLEQSEKIRALEREIDGVRRQLGAEILRADQAQASIERVRELLPEDPRDDHGTIPMTYTALRAALDGTEPATEQPPYAVLRAAYDESWQLIEMQKEFIGSLRRTIMTATSHREDENITAERCEYCGRDHMAELYDATVAVDKLYAERFPATADGPARPGRLPEQHTPEA